ncbi:MAG: PKD domain-containing protein, partial [Candidatus Thermoplasmatota archaeon]
VKEYWSNDYFGIVNWYGHGSPIYSERKYWRDDGDGIPEKYEFFHPQFINTDDTFYLSDENPSIVFSASCSNACPDSQKNLGISILKNGAVSFIGSTTVSWGSIGWDKKQDGGIQTINYLFMNYLLHYDYTCGKSLYQSLFDYSKDYDYWGWKSYQNLYGYVLYGDPYLSLKTKTDFLPPETPDKPEGSSTGNVSESLSFSTFTVDEDNQDIYYRWDWDDGTYSEWIGPHPSGKKVEISHIWDEPGVYNVRVKASDSIGAKSGWSQTKEVTIIGPDLKLQEIKGGIGRIKAIIKNEGKIAAMNFSWSIKIQNFLFSRHTTGKIDQLAPNEQIAIKSDILLGIGKANVTVELTQQEIQKKTDFFIIGPFILKI